jgi:hypothetical protein
MTRQPNNQLAMGSGRLPLVLSVVPPARCFRNGLDVSITGVQVPFSRKGEVLVAVG